MTLNDYYKKPLFFVGYGRARDEISRNLISFVSRIQEGCIEGYKEMCDEEAPIKDCEEDNIIIIEEKEKIEINQEGGCVFILSPEDEQERAADALLFRIFGLRNF